LQAEWTATRVVDGDTLIVNDGAREHTVRIIGINTPERGECYADDASRALEAMVAGARLTLITDVSDTDQYGRLLRYVETSLGVDVGAALVAGGFAIARRYEPDVVRDDAYRDLQNRARADDVGLWAADACGTAAQRGVIDIEVNADPPGDDTDDLNGEWVRFTNTSDSDIDLRDWQVADESASNRYSFDNVVLRPGAAITLYTGCGTNSDDRALEESLRDERAAFHATLGSPDMIEGMTAFLEKRRPRFNRPR